MRHKHSVDSTGKLIEHKQSEQFPHHRAMRYTASAIWKCVNADAFDFVHALRMHQLLVREYFPMHAFVTAFPMLGEAEFGALVRKLIAASSRDCVFDFAPVTSNIDGQYRRGDYMRDAGIAACLRGIRTVEILSEIDNVLVLRMRTKMPRRIARNLRWPAEAVDLNMQQFQLHVISSVLSSIITGVTGIPVVVSHCDDRIKIMPDFYQIMAAYERDLTMPDLGMRAAFAERRRAKKAALRWVRKRWGYPDTNCYASACDAADAEAEAVVRNALADGVDVVAALDENFRDRVHAEVEGICADVESGFSETETDETDDADADEFGIEPEEDAEEAEEEGQ